MLTETHFHVMGPHWPEFCPLQQHKTNLFSLAPESSLTILTETKSPLPVRRSS